jgi:hypothetical protein
LLNFFFISCILFLTHSAIYLYFLWSHWSFVKIALSIPCLAFHPLWHFLIQLLKSYALSKKSNCLPFHVFKIYLCWDVHIC